MADICLFHPWIAVWSPCSIISEMNLIGMRMPWRRYLDACVIVIPSSSRILFLFCPTLGHYQIKFNKT